jgi:hypothetical protein
MLYADAIRRQAEDAPRAALPAVTSALWKAFAEGHVTEAEAATLSALIDTRRATPAGQSPNPPGTLASAEENTSQYRQNRPRTGVGSQPRTDASLERRRRWAASGRLPPAIAARFTPGEQAALSLVVAETARKGDCRLAVEHMAAAAGVSRSTMKAAIREAKKLGLITVEERKVAGWRNDTNIIRIIDPQLTAWLRLTRRPPVSGSGLSLRHEQKGGGVISPTTTSTHVSKQGKTRIAEARQRRSASPDRASRGSSRIAGA